MQTDRLFRVAATAWLVTAIARVVLAVTRAGPPGDDGLPVDYAIGFALGLLVGALLWFRPGRGSAIVASAIGFYPVVGIAYFPLIGPQAWFLVLSALGLIAFGLAVACLLATRRPGPSGDTDREA